MRSHEGGPGAVPAVVSFAEAAGLDAAVLGSKAATLARLAAAGFPVPPGLVVTAHAEERWEESRPRILAAAAQLGARRFAVRSSAAAEDLAEASFAGQYESVLDVPADGLGEAIRQVLDSAAATRVAAYTRARTDSPAEQARSRMAVLVQVMVEADAAGVAFSANPVTGDRDQAVVSAVRGLGERLVSGRAVGDEWLVRDQQATCRRAPEDALRAAQAVEVAALARRVAEHFGRPQDIEWAIAAGTGTLWLLQARPMTALPEPVAWAPPGPGYWMRNFRLGEWLPEPMTPLFRDWLLERIEAGYLTGMRQTAGAALAFEHAAVNGWYYTRVPRRPLRTILPAVLRTRGRILWFVYNGLVRVGRDPAAADRALLGALADAWRGEVLPRYRRVVAEAERQAGSASPQELPRLVDQVGGVAGQALWSLAIVGGSAWKMEGCLARFHRRHLAASAGERVGSVQVLLRGLPGTQPEVPAYAVQSADWYHPTAGELGWEQDRAGAGAVDRHRQLAAERMTAEAACRAALGDQPRLLARFNALLEVAQRYAAIREEQARQLTLGWPLLRRCALRLGQALQARGAIARAEDVFFLTRDELGGDAARQEVVTRRRSQWERQRRLVAPLTLGRPPRLLHDPVAGMVEAVRTAGTGALPAGAIVGQPASPGRATGPVRIVRGADDADRFQPGEVLVARATTPAWTPLFARAAAVVTDSGTLAAHASLVAREYGIPAVVGTGDATARLHDGQVVTVDGGAGTIAPRQ
jgi:phosphohistidine swiveling domain-containing protein